MKKHFSFFKIKFFIITSLLTFSFGTFYAQNLTEVSGTVKDEYGEALIGVAVSLVGEKGGAITDIDGKYSIKDVPSKVVLKFTYIGYKTIEENVKGRSSINIIMKEATQDLDELVVIGYGVTKRSDLTGSVASIKAEDLEKFPASNVTEMLRGQAAGVSVTLDNSAPGGASKVQIRGVRTLTGGQDPLFLVDGMVVPHINDLNSNDIESIEILKDASSQAIYGSRASNGVIMVTTKRGKEGKFSIDFSAQVGVQDYHRNFDLYSPEEYAKLRFWAKYNEGTGNIGTPDNINYDVVFAEDSKMLQAFQNGNRTNWEDLMTTNAVQQKYDISLRGGNDKIRYSAGFGFLDQEGLIIGSGYKRGNMRSNIDYSPQKWVDFGLNISFSRAETNSADNDFNDFITIPAFAPAYKEDGSLERDPIDGIINPLWKNKEYTKQQLDDYLAIATNITLRPLENLTYRFGVNLRTNDREVGDYKTKLYPGSTGQGSYAKYNRSSYLIDNVLTYDVPFKNDMHKLQATLIQSVDQDLAKTTSLNFNQSTSDKFNWNVFGDSEITSINRTLERKRSVSFAGRLQYGFKERYLLTASLRRDGASVFGSENKWANIPSVAFAWRVNEESFMKSLEWINQLKARVSYGKVGNWGIAPYRTLGLANSYEYLFADQLTIGYLPVNELNNKALRWETTQSVNYGVDFSILNSRLNGTIEYYNTKSKDLLMKRTVPSITGYESMWDNLGETRSRGLEVSLNGDIIRSKDLTWNLGASISTQSSEIIKIDGRIDKNGKPINDLANKWFIGETIGVIYDYVFGGIWQEGEAPEPHQYLEGDAAPVPGDIKLADYNKDGKITTDDRKVYNTRPKWYGTINTSVNYKKFDFQAEFYTVQKVYKNNPYLYGYDQGGSLNGKKNGLKVNYWTPENPSNDAPRPQFTAAVPFMGIIGIQDASYFRLRSATIGYTLPRQWMSKFNITRARVYATATNIFTITDYKSYSPEKEPGSYPEPRTLTFGLNVSF